MAVQSAAIVRDSDSLISWKSIFGGFLVTLFSLACLLGLGLAVGGISMEDGVSSMKSASIATVAWFVISVLLAIFVGSYFTARFSRFDSPRIGAANGLVIAALVFSFFVFEAMMGAGVVGRMSGGVFDAASKRMDVLESRVVMNVLEDEIGDLNLLNEPDLVAAGLLGRMLQGDDSSASHYLARNAGISINDATMRVAGMRERFEAARDEATKKASAGITVTGWSLFGATLLWAIVGILGGALGSRVNYRRPLVRDEVYDRDYRAAS